MGTQTNSIEGIGPSLGTALHKPGVNTVDKLLDAGCNKKGRIMLAAKTKINEARLLNWINMADLFRKVPTAKMVKSWVEQAKALPPKITH